MGKYENFPGQMSLFDENGNFMFGNLAKKVEEPKKTLKGKSNIVNVDIQKTKPREVGFERLQEMFEKAIKIVDEMGFPLEVINRPCEIHDGFTHKWGLCRHNRYSGNFISVSKKLMKCDENEILQVLIHEVLHATKGCHNHGDLWKSRANAINRKYGYHISRCADESKLLSEDLIISENRFVFRCTVCGKLITKNKTCEFVSNFKDYYHKGCANSS